MSFSEPHKYTLFKNNGYYGESSLIEIDMIYMSGAPSKDDVIEILRQKGQLNALQKEAVDSLVLKRPDGWYHKKILVYDKNNLSKFIWKFEPVA